MKHVGGSFDGGEGRFEFVGQSVDHENIQFFAAADSFGAIGGLLGLRLG